MFWLGCLLGYIVGSVITCGLLYFCFRSEENKKADMQKKNGRWIGKEGNGWDKE
ncbi:hypothetical protein [Bacillus sp. B1-WWTP-T-0.5-Post-4]|uniref:hypothetical protein n=1 Tax=Bacillus sp. B1-WWTP-T-0.5-Post-4 TaxID=2653219 RepID=UPI00186A8EAD|nr:hypothetical protein [Bacillus sp. B1-WWTP-T-0.5-Post-4]